MQELNKGARRPAGVPAAQFSKIGVLGAGFMGAGIAYVTAQAGIEVVLLDRDKAVAPTRARRIRDELISAQVDEGPRQARRQATRCSRRITPTADYADLAGCDLVIEAVFEDRARQGGGDRKAEAVLEPGGDLRLQHLDPADHLACRSIRRGRRISSASISSRRSSG